MPADFSIKANDRLPFIEATLGFEAGGVPDLSDPATVVSFIMRKDGDPLPPKVNSAAVIVDVPTALVRYLWAIGDTDAPGTYNAEWEVVYADGKTQTFPTTSYHVIDIVADLDEAA